MSATSCIITWDTLCAICYCIEVLNRPNVKKIRNSDKRELRPSTNCGWRIEVAGQFASHRKFNSNEVTLRYRVILRRIQTVLQDLSERSYQKEKFEMKNEITHKKRRK